jgi:hypothetical protein
MALLLLKDIYSTEVIPKNRSSVQHMQKYVAIPVAPKIQNTIKIEEKKKPLPILVKHELPKGLKSVDSVFHRTAWVGTLEHPTIDGGMINAADGMPINREQPKIASEVKVQKNILVPENPDNAGKQVATMSLEVLEKSAQDKNKKFNDTWATDGHVKRLLNEAAKEGRLDYVLSKAEEMGLPASVALVPMVESRYQMHALSHKGAAGPWQIMPETAKDYGLQVHQRFEWVPSTQAALRLLNDLYGRFGSWDLAFAAYNAGAGRVEKALKKDPSAKDVYELDLPKETKMYVKRLHQVSSVLSAAEKLKS